MSSPAPGAAEPAAPPPAGFAYVSRAPFVNHVGPILQAVENAPGEMRLGLRVAEVHCNSLGFMHGGMIATLADSAMARAMVSVLERRALTLKMELEYLDTVNLGDWLEARARLATHDADIAHTACDILADGKLRAKAAGVFRLLRKRGG